MIRARWWASVVGGLCALAADPAAQEQPLQERLQAVRAELRDGRAELAQWAMDHELFVEAAATARAVVLEEPDHPLREMRRALEAMDTAGFGIRYRRARQRLANEFARRRARVVEPAAKELVQIGEEAEEAGDEALAEEAYALAYRVDPGQRKAARALEGREYELVFNYGALPGDEKRAAREALRELGGSFLGEPDLRSELSFWPDAWGLGTRHYRFVTNATHDKVFAFARACEDLHAAWEELAAAERIPLRRIRKPMVVYLFDTPVTYQAILRAGDQQPPAGALGFYDSATKVGYFYDDDAFYAGDLQQLFETFYHEGTHQILDVRGRTRWRGQLADHPLHWMEEGLALYMETLVVEVDGEDRRYVLGSTIDDDLDIGLSAFERDVLLPLPEFVHLDRDGWDAYDLGYPHAALAMHWLLESGKPRLREGAFALLHEERQQGGTKRKTFFEFLGLSEDEASAALRAHAARIRAELPVRAYAKDRRDR